MNIGVITVFFTENCGSVLQSYALKKKLEDMGNTVFFIPTNNKYSGHSFSKMLKEIIKSVFNFHNPFCVIKKYLYYNKFIKKEFRIEKDYNKFDLIIEGSDTVWDIDSKYFLESKNIFWPNINNKNIISYATSIANSNYIKLDELNYPIQSLSKFKSISVRDDYTKKYIDSRLNIDSIKMPDPTFLLDKEEYLITKKIKEKYILLYLFENIDEKFVNDIKKFAFTKGLKIFSIIGVGKNNKFADKYLIGTISNFLDYFNSAEYIITDTFHGTVFSIIFNKKFIVINRNKNKISNLLNDLNITNRIVFDKIDILDNDINYNVINTKLLEYRKKGVNFLKESINEI